MLYHENYYAHAMLAPTSISIAAYPGVLFLPASAVGEASDGDLYLRNMVNPRLFCSNEFAVHCDYLLPQLHVHDSLVSRHFPAMQVSDRVIFS